MSDKLPWLPFYISDWENDRRVRAMGPVARSYYLTLLICQWREGSLPADRKTLQRLLVLPCDPLRSDLQLSLNSDPHQRMDGIDHDAVLDQVLECFDLTDAGVFVNARLNSIREQQLRVVEAKSRGGKQSAKSGKGVSQDSSKSVGQRQRESQSQIETKNQKRGKHPLPTYSQSDFDERDLRRLADARTKVRERIEAIVGCDPITEQEFMTAVLEECGLKEARVRELDKMTKWTGATA